MVHNFTRTALLVTALLAVLTSAACSSDDPSKEPSEPLPTPTLPDGRHFLADKPLKLFDKDKSERLKLAEDIERAERRVDGYKELIRNPAFDMSLDKPVPGTEPIPLEKATRGIKGKGPLKATIETSLGTFTCTLDGKGAPVGVSHFVALTRGVNLWWNGHTRNWSTDPFYDGRFAYKIQKGEAIHLGLPPQAGDARLKNPMILAVSEASQPHPVKAYDIAILRAHKLAPLHTNFLVAAVDNPVLKELAYPIGKCEPYDVIQKIAGKQTTPDQVPLEEISIKSVKISR